VRVHIGNPNWLTVPFLCAACSFRWQFAHITTQNGNSFNTADIDFARAISLFFWSV
jgi:hypothetical protein